MKVAVGFDHAGFPLKQTVLQAVRDVGHEIIDLGTNSAERWTSLTTVKKVDAWLKVERLNEGFWSVAQGLACVLPRTNERRVRVHLPRYLFRCARCST